MPGPSFRREFFDLPVGGGGQAGEDVAQIGIRIEATLAATLDDGVEDGAAFAGLGFADEEPVLFAEGGGADGVFYQVLIDLDAAVVEVDAEQGPKVQRVLDGQAHAAAGQVTSLHFQASEHTIQPLVNRVALMRARHLPQDGYRLVFTKFPFDAIEWPIWRRSQLTTPGSCSCAS